jgi:GNAT superfamily N-acetyltransferase
LGGNGEVLFMNIVVKRLDVTRIGELAAQGEMDPWLREVDGRYAPPGGCFLVAADWGESGGPLTIAATGGYRRVSAEVCEAGRLVVKQAFQGQGLGKLMMRALTDQARQAGYVRMRAEAPAEVAELVAFYKREGFSEVGAFRIATLEELEGRVFLERALG